MTPDYQTAALKATEILIKYQISSAPVLPLPIFKRAPGVLALSFTEMSRGLRMDRDNLITMLGVENQDAVTSVHMEDGKLRYVVAFNQRLPLFLLQRALARELGHIVLGHDGSRPDDVRYQEAMCFAYHLLCPRPLIHAIQQSGTRFTVEVLGNMTGCYERCLLGIRETPGVHIPADMNRAVRELFNDYINNFLSFQSILVRNDHSALADFGSYMDGYEE